MGFRNSLTNAGFGQHIQPGLRALSANSQRIQCRTQQAIQGSIDLDSACQTAEPNAARWDYGIGIISGNSTRTEWVEVHPATSSETKHILAKLAWLKNKIRDWQAPCDIGHSRFHWIATGGVHIDQKKKRQLAQAGLKMPQKRLSLPSR